MRKTIIAGNWKMNCSVSETEARLSALLKDIPPDSKAMALVCPPYTSLMTAAKFLKGSQIALGAQDMSEHESGAYTGEVSARMLLTVGATHVILGHSERRQYHAETDQLVNTKARAALAKDLTPIICVGETLEEREADKTEQVIGTQVDTTLSGLSADEIKKTVIAYEPVWAIGTGKTATPEMAEAVHRFIREKLARIDATAAEVVPILYGGSMKPDNAAGLLSQPDIDGGLIGGASLKADAFIGIIKAV